MNRRTSIKSILLLATASISSFSAYEYFSLKKKPDLSYLYAKKQLVAELAEVIIPRTDTPGAKDAKVEDFIIGMIEFCSDSKTQKNFINGLSELEDYTAGQYKKDFLQLSANEKNLVMSHFESKAEYSSTLLNKVSGKVFGKPFFSLLKNLTAEGFCSSQLGATQAMAYDYVPGRFEACIPIKNNQKAWATK